MNELFAKITVLEFKLQRIKEHIQRRLEVADPTVAPELQYILDMIGQFESVPADWRLPEPLVPECNIPREDEK